MLAAARAHREPCPQAWLLRTIAGSLGWTPRSPSRHPYRQTVQSGDKPAPSSQRPRDPSIRRTWWLLLGAFLLLGIVNGVRLLGSGSPIDWLTVILVILAAIAAIGHRNAVAGLEAGGRGEAETFARILHGLTRSVSPDAIVAAIMDELVDATGADHAVLVRRRRDGTALEATLVTRRSGVPSTTTVMPLADLDGPADRPGRTTVGVPVGPGERAGEPAGEPVGDASAADEPKRTRVRREPLPGREALAGHDVDAAVPGEGAAAATPEIGARPTLLRRGLSEGLALLRDLGVPTPDIFGERRVATASEVLGRDDAAAIAGRITERVRAVFGLSHTLAAPLRSERRVMGAIVLSRRDRAAWPESARRLMLGAAAETSAALARADTYREVAERASTDPLTGLPNRRYFDEFSSLIARRRRAGDAVAVLMVDIDRFKLLNDTYGHPAGDAVLKAVAGAIASAVRDQDVPARVGGEEFAVLLRNPGPDVAFEVGERVRSAVRDLDFAPIGVAGVSVSIGVANASGPEESIPALVDRADRALLRAKRAGRDRVIAD
jgi:diguanylate cyclase (GGDEF)-like protein